MFERGSHSVEVAGTLLVTMGLIGTVMELTLTLGGLTRCLDALGQNQARLLDGLRQEMRMVYALNRPWWVRFMSLLPGGK